MGCRASVFRRRQAGQCFKALQSSHTYCAVSFTQASYAYLSNFPVFPSFFMFFLTTNRSLTAFCPCRRLIFVQFLFSFSLLEPCLDILRLRPPPPFRQVRLGSLFPHPPTSVFLSVPPFVYLENCLVLCGLCYQIEYINIPNVHVLEDFFICFM